jgi:hypothetical protein
MLYLISIDSRFKSRNLEISKAQISISRNPTIWRALVSTNTSTSTSFVGVIRGSVQRYTLPYLLTLTRLWFGCSFFKIWDLISGRAELSFMSHVISHSHDGHGSPPRSMTSKPLYLERQFFSGK